MRSGVDLGETTASAAAFGEPTLKTFRLLLLATFPFFALTGCSPKPPVCDLSTCGTGCCDLSGQCQPGSVGEACGSGAQLCSQCLPGQLCNQGFCRASGTGGGSGGGTGTGGGTGGGTTGPLMCGAGRTACSSSCVDTRTDGRNCGACGNLCNSNQFCSSGTCTLLPAACAGGCPSGFFCTPGNECKPGCAANADCPQPGSCDTRLNACTCLTGFHACGQACEADNNTGACGPSCASCDGVPNAVAACTGNRCDFTCNPGLHRCGNECKSDNDIATCGTSCTQCTPPPNSVAFCANAACDFACNSGFHRCGNACVANNSVDSCGASSCSPCTAPANGTATCNGFSCDFTCNAGFHRCGSACVSNTSVNSCGSSCSACTPPSNSTASCDGVSCGFTCNSGSHGCNGACVSNLSVNSCGATSCTPCTPPFNGVATCNGVSCDFTCNTGTHRCSSTCATNTDVNSCGSSCTPCPNGPANSVRTCNGAACGWQCATGFHDCGGTCVSNTSVTQCGAACTLCPAVANAVPQCLGGACDFACNVGFHKCGSACVANTDVNACGSSCSPCPNGPANSTRTCNGTSCGFSCGGGFNACGGECVPPDFASACGSACSACTATGTFDRPICSGGACGTACITSCNSACVDVTRDPANCGACNQACSGGQACTGGECRASCTTGLAFDGALPYVPVSANAGYKLLVEDLNGDGRVDLVDNGSTAGLHVRYSNADGTFQAPVLMGTASSRANSFVLVDVNADGRKDIVATRASTVTPNVFVWLNTGTAFTATSSIGMSGYQPSLVMVADINNDTRPDLIVPASATYFFYFVQTVSNTFPTTYSHWSTNTLTNPIYGEVGDFNKDSRPDLVVATTTQYQVLLSNPAASFTSPITAWSPQTSTALTSIGGVKVADLNADTNLDLIFRTASSGHVVLGTGTATFNAGTALTFPGAPGSAILPVDLNGDSVLDLVSGGSGLVYYSMASAPGVWPTASSRLLNAADTQQIAIGAGQLIGTAAPEIFSAPQSSTSVQVSILLNDGTATLPGARVSGTSTTNAAAATGDVDGDGDRDLLVAPAIGTGGSGTGSVLVGDNTGTFGAALSTVALRGDELAFGRLNGDAFADLVASIESTTTPGVDVFLGGAAGTFAAPVRLATTSLPTRVAIANVDSDAIADIVVGTTTAVEWFRGNGDGTFGAAQVAVAGQGNTQAFAVADLNLDGKADLLVNSGTTTGTLRVFLGYGTGAFALTAFATVTTGLANDVVATDFDRDGRLDVAVGTSTGVALFKGSGSGALVAQTPQSQLLGRLNVADLDNDGFMDLISMNGEVQVARGQANFTFFARQNFVPGRPLVPGTLLVDRFNGDTFRDVLVLSTSTEVWTYTGLCR